jgi:hypothetical protein
VIEQHLGAKGGMNVRNAVGSEKQAKELSSTKNGGEIEQVMLPYWSGMRWPLEGIPSQTSLAPLPCAL